FAIGRPSRKDWRTLPRLSSRCCAATSSASNWSGSKTTTDERKQGMSGSNEASARIAAAVEKRFGERMEVDSQTAGAGEIARMLEHCTHRKWTGQTVAPELLRLLCAAALSAPSKSDLQQTDIVQVADRAQRQAIVATIDEMDWIM